jgi:GxxExxY protein
MHRVPLIEQALTRSVIGVFYDVYNAMGYGFLESIYGRVLERELISRGHSVAREVGVIVRYKGDPVGVQRLDMVVDGKLIVEVKSTERVPQSVMRQLFSYLKASHLDVGLLLHFGPEPKFYRQIFRHPSPIRSDQADGSDAGDATDGSDDSDLKDLRKEPNPF